MDENRSTRQLGNEGEQSAKEYLIHKGFDILAQNYRYKRGEVDLIAQKGNLIVFIEVKWRKNDLFGNPEDFVNPKKIELIHQCAEHFMENQPISFPIRFDIISITKDKLVHLEDAF